MAEKLIYLDNQATTRVDPRVLEAMLPYFTEHYGNAASRNHVFGWRAEEAVEKARAEVASLIGADPREIVFTSGATESNNLALKGAFEFYREKGGHLVTEATEHKCVLDTCRALESRGASVTVLPVTPTGRVELAALEAALSDRTILASIMFANNEIGTIQPVAEIGSLLKSRGVLFHCDAAQALGKVRIDVRAMGIDLMSLSAHKLYGPKGVGALYVRRKDPRVRLAIQMDGGGHERGMRSGTLNVPGIVGFGAACAIAAREMTAESQRIHALRERLHGRLLAALDMIYLNGDPVHRLDGNLNISFAFVEGEGLMMSVKDVCVSSGSACTSASLEPSYVLRALGVGEDLAHTSIRMGIGRFNTAEEIDAAADRLVAAVKRLRQMSPLYEMAQQGIDPKSVQWTGH